MFSGEESMRIRSALPREEMENVVADALDRLGAVKFTGRSRFRVRAGRFDSALANVTIDGELTKGRKDGEWNLTLFYQVKPSALCWVIAIVGFIFLLLGPLIFLAPNSTKNDVQRAVYRAARDAADGVEDEGERTKD